MTTYIQTELGNLTPLSDAAVPINKGIAEIQDLSKRRGGYTKTIVIAGDKTAHQIFGHYYDVNIQAGTFNHKRKVTADIIQDDQIIFSGFMRLLNIRGIAPTSGTFTQNIEYEISITDGTSSFYQDLSDKKLIDLDISYLDHEYGIQAVVESKQHTIADGYKYVWAMKPERRPYRIQDFMPAVYAKVYWDQIFESAGYTYEWPDLDSPAYRFDKLLAPYTNGEIKADDQDSFQLQTSLDNGYKIEADFVGSSLADNFVEPAPTKVVDSIILSDPNQLYSIPLDVYELPIAQDVNDFSIEIDMNWSWFIDNQSQDSIRFFNEIPASEGQFNLHRLLPIFQIYDETNDQVLASTTYSSIPNDLRLTIPSPNNKFNFNEPGWSYAPNQLSPIIGFSNTTPNQPGQHQQFSYQFTLETNVPEIEPNTQISLRIGFLIRNNNNELINVGAPLGSINSALRVGTPATVGSGFLERDASLIMDISQLTYTFKPTQQGLNPGMNVPMNIVIPNQITQREFIKGVLNHFNLYTTVDPQDNKNIIIQGRDEFYDSGAEFDWSSKIDVSQPMDQQLSIIPELKRRKLTYTPGSDILNQGYTDNVGEVYGEATYVFDDEFAKDEDTQTVPWEPTPIVKNDLGQYVLGYDATNIKAKMKLVYDGVEVTEPSSNLYPVILFGKPTLQEIEDDKIVQQDPRIAWVTSGYNYTGHFDNPILPQWDLNFNICSYYFYNEWTNSDTSDITRNNMFFLHHARTFNQLETGRVLEAYFALDSNDIAQLKLNDRVYVHDAWWNIIEIKDYNANSAAPTFVRLISVDTQQFLKGFFSKNLENPGSVGGATLPIADPDKEFRLPYRPLPSSPLRDPIKELERRRLYRTNIFHGNSGDVKYLGQGNIINSGVNNVFILGDYNHIVEGDNILVIGDNITTTNEYSTAIYLGDIIITDLGIFGPGAETFIESFQGEGIRLNNRTIGGVKYFIENNDTLDIPKYWQYNVVGKVDIDGLVNNDGQINLLK